LFFLTGRQTGAAVPAFDVGPDGMNLLLWFSVCCLLTAACFEPLTNLPTVANAIPLSFLLLDEWLMVVDKWLNGIRKLAKRGRYASIKYETLRASGEFSGEDFQNTGIFIVVKSSAFSKSSVQKTHLARDTYNAYSPGA
jgi:hypothetical protein